MLKESPPSCRRCGTCCLSGGPALHLADKPLLEADSPLEPGQLITIRRGELVLRPLSEKPSPATLEFIKVAGGPGVWSCCFFDRRARNCLIYNRRPVECILLQCQAPQRLLSIVEKDLLCRTDLITDKAQLEMIDRHEQACSCSRMEELLALLAIKQKRSFALAALNSMIMQDLELRHMAFLKRGVDPALEMLLFGRPLFKLLTARGFQVREHNGLVVLDTC